MAIDKNSVLDFVETKRSNKINYSSHWIVDSGCSNHMTGDESKLQSKTKYKGTRMVVTANNAKLPISHVGDVMCAPTSCNDSIKLEDVYHVPSMNKNLMSVSQLAASGNYVVFGPNDVKVFKNLQVTGSPIMEGRRIDSIYVMSAEAAYVDKTRKNETTDLWHARLAHVGYSKLDIMMKKELVKGLPKLEVRDGIVCAGCQFGKAHQLPFSVSTFQAKESLELVHSDVFGPVKDSSIGGMRYMLTFIDDFSRFVWVYFMKEKSEVFKKFEEFKEQTEKELGCKIRCLRSDNGGEYTSDQFKAYLRKHGVRRQLTCPNTPQQNGIAERKNRHLSETCRSMMHAKNVPARFWAECMTTAAYVINRLPQAKLGFISPYQKLFGRKPIVSHFRVFGSVCYVLVADHLRSKFDKKAVRCIFVGYDLERKGWRCIDPSTNRPYISRNVVFDEASSWWSPDWVSLPACQRLENEVNERLNSFNPAESEIELSETHQQQPTSESGGLESIEEHRDTDTLSSTDHYQQNP